MIASCIASNGSHNRRKFANILHKSAPFIFLPFFTLTGANLQLSALKTSALFALYVFMLSRSLFVRFCVPSICSGRCVLSVMSRLLDSILFAVRVISIAVASIASGRLCDNLTAYQSKYLWMTLLTQAGNCLYMLTHSHRAHGQRQTLTQSLGVEVLNRRCRCWSSRHCARSGQ